MNRAERRKMDKKIKDASVDELKQEIRYLKARMDAVMNEVGDYAVAQKGMDIQQACDFLAIAAHEEFGFAEARNHRLQEAFHRVFMRYMNMSVEDYGYEKKDLTPREILLGYKPDMKYGDEDRAYTHAKLDADLKAAVGKYFIPFEVRYEMENLYSRDRDVMHKTIDTHNAQREALRQKVLKDMEARHEV